MVRENMSWCISICKPCESFHRIDLLAHILLRSRFRGDRREAPVFIYAAELAQKCSYLFGKEFVPNKFILCTHGNQLVKFFGRTASLHLLHRWQYSHTILLAVQYIASIVLLRCSTGSCILWSMWKWESIPSSLISLPVSGMLFLIS